MRRLQYGNAARRRGGETGRDQTGAGTRARQIAEVFRAVEKTEVGRGGGIERRNVADAPLGRIAFAQFGARQRNDLADRQLTVRFDKIGHSRPARGLRRDQNCVPPPKAKNWVRSYDLLRNG